MTYSARFLLLLVTVSATTGAQQVRPDSGSHGHKVAVPSITAVRITGPVSIDGNLSEAAWQLAPIASGFRQTDPVEGALATQRTEVRFLVDDDALYVGAKLFDTEGRRGVRPQLARRDQGYDADWFELAFDTFHDHVRRFFMSVTPSGSKNDEIGVGSSCCDPGWDPIWEVRTRIDDDGWTAEIRIPFSQIRMPGDSIQTWGLQLKRVAIRSNETSLWAFWRRDEPGGAPRYGHLENLVVGIQPKHVEILPYAVTRRKEVASVAGDPFAAAQRNGVRAGADVKYLVTPNLTMTAAINPDFGQVEADPADINLSGFETFFAEKRPFFVEGAGAFRFGRTACRFCSNTQGVESFYSRRVGRAPTATGLAYDAGDWVDAPDASAILAAAKLTGRVSKGLTLGVLDATTRREEARVQFADGTRGRIAVEPATNFLVARATSDHRNGKLVAGAYASSVTRGLSGDLSPLFTRHAEMAGADLESYWKNNRYTVFASVMGSNIAGDPAAITSRQRAIARYFQRPDDTRPVDASATSVQGAGGYLRVAKDAGSWTWESSVNTRTPGYEVNDIAFQSRADFAQFIGNIGRLFNTPTSLYRRVNLTLGGQYQRNYQGLETPGQQVHAAFNVLTPQFWTVSGFTILRPATLDDRLLRGGPAVEVPSSRTFQTGISSDARRRLNASVSAAFYTSSLSEEAQTVSLTVNARPMSNMVVSATPSLSRELKALQYVSSRSDAAATQFYGTRYILASLKQTTTAMELRTSVTLSPTLTFDLYTQPLIGSASFFRFKEFAAPRQARVLVYGSDVGTITPVADPANATRTASYTVDPDGTGPSPSFSLANPDFTSQSLRGNAVVRWEYRPGSTLYFAWTQSRDAGSADGDFDFQRQSNLLIRSRPDNIFLVKASWWWSR